MRTSRESEDVWKSCANVTRYLLNAFVFFFSILKCAYLTRFLSMFKMVIITVSLERRWHLVNCIMPPRHHRFRFQIDIDMSFESNLTDWHWSFNAFTEIGKKNNYLYEYMYVFSYQIFDENVFHNVNMSMDEYRNELTNVWIMLMNV